jgi:cyanate permease
MIGPPVAGWSYDTSGNYAIVWMVLAGLAIVSAFLILLTERDRPHGQAV